MILVDHELKEIGKDIIFPFDEDLVNPSSVDIRLGHIILIDDSGGFKEKNILETTKESPFLIPPNGFVLACTYEYFHIPLNYAADLKLKSSRAREGLGHALSGHVDNAFSGSLTLELKNYSMYNPVAIYFKQRIGQLLLHRTDTPDKGYENGRYAGYDVPVLSKDLALK